MDDARWTMAEDRRAGDGGARLRLAADGRVVAPVAPLPEVRGTSLERSAVTSSGLRCPGAGRPLRGSSQSSSHLNDRSGGAA